jgi:membrane protein
VARGRPLLERFRDRVAHARDRSPLADEVVRTVDRYLDVQASLLAAGLTYYGFLAVFPLVAVGLGVASVLSRVVPRLSRAITDQVTQVVPNADIPALQTSSIVVGVIGLAVMLYAGVRWVGHLRRSFALLWGREPRSTPYLRGLLRDLLTLALLGLAVLVSVALTVLTQLATGVLADWMGDTAYAWLLKVLSLVLALLTDFALGLVLFRALPDSGLTGRPLVEAAVLTGLGFEVLKQAAALIIAPASHNIVYGTFAATVGVLVWIAYGCRWILLVGAWSAVRLERRERASARPGDARAAAQPERRGGQQEDGGHRDHDPGLAGRP